MIRSFPLPMSPHTANTPASRVVECLGSFGLPAEHSANSARVKFSAAGSIYYGSWFVRWGVNYFTGRSGRMRALETFPLNGGDYCQARGVWLRHRAESDGALASR